MRWVALIATGTVTALSFCLLFLSSVKMEYHILRLAPQSFREMYFEHVLDVGRGYFQQPEYKMHALDALYHDVTLSDKRFLQNHYSVVLPLIDTELSKEINYQEGIKNLSAVIIILSTDEQLLLEAKRRYAADWNTRAFLCRKFRQTREFDEHYYISSREHWRTVFETNPALESFKKCL